MAIGHKATFRLLLLLAALLTLAGCPGPLVGPAAIIRYQQIGACNGVGTAVGTIGPGASEALVLFQIDSIDNTQTGLSFAFDPAKLYVSGPRDEFINPSLTAARAFLGNRQVQARTIQAGQQTSFPPASYGMVVVATTNP